MTIYQQIMELLKDKKNSTVKLSWVKDQLHIKYNINPSSVILSDYCYNRINDGIKFDKHIFGFLGEGQYRYLGENKRYTGLIYHKPMRSNVEYIVGEWNHGVKMFYDEPRIRQ